MAVKKYLNLQGLTEVAEYVNKKLRIVTEMPSPPTIDDIVVYNGTTTAKYKQGSTYLYTIKDVYYAWENSPETLYTLSQTPQEGDTVYSDAIGTDSGYTVQAFDSLNQQITVHSTLYDRETSGDTPFYDWIAQTGSSVILNGENKAGMEAEFYAPTGAGTAGQIPISNGENAAPTWGTFSGYAPTVVEDELIFMYGTQLPEVENTTIIFNID